MVVQPQSRDVVALGDRVDAVIDADAACRSSSSAFFGNDPSVALPAYATIDLEVKIAHRATGWSYSRWAQRQVQPLLEQRRPGGGGDTDTRIAALPGTYGIAVELWK